MNYNNKQSKEFGLGGDNQSHSKGTKKFVKRMKKKRKITHSRRPDNFFDWFENRHDKKRITWLVILMLWIGMMVASVIIQQSRQGMIFINIIFWSGFLGFFGLWLGVFGFLHPEKLWRFGQKFQWHIKGGVPTDFGIFINRFSGLVMVIITFAAVAMASAFNWAYLR